MTCNSNAASSSLFLPMFVLGMIINHCLAFTHTAPLTGTRMQRQTQTDILVVVAASESNFAAANDDGAPTTVMTTANLGLGIQESDFMGAGVPRPDLRPEDLPTLLMEALRHNDFPHVDAGLQAMWEFCSDTTRHVFQHNRTEFIESAHETANEFPTSFYGNTFYGRDWNMETELNRIGGGSSGAIGSGDNRGGDDDGDTSWIATQVMKTISSDGRMRRWQWEIRKNKRPPNLNCWFVESIASSDRKGEFEPEDN